MPFKGCHTQSQLPRTSAVPSNPGPLKRISHFAANDSEKTKRMVRARLCNLHTGLCWGLWGVAVFSEHCTVPPRAPESTYTGSTIAQAAAAMRAWRGEGPWTFHPKGSHVHRAPNRVDFRLSRRYYVHCKVKNKLSSPSKYK